MKLRDRNYPHPVVGHRDDVPDAGFQVSVRCNTDRANVYFTAETMCGSDTLLDLIDAGDASYRLHVECGRTMYRVAHPLPTEKERVTIAAQHVAEDVEVVPFIIAERDLINYQPEGMHPDYGDARWSVSRGDVLAVGEGKVFHIDHHFDALRRVGSLLQIRKGDFREGPVKVDLSAPRKIIVDLAIEDYELYQRLRTNPAYADQLSTAIVLPALMQALREIKQMEQEGQTLPQWAERLRGRVQEVGGGDGDDLFVAAQRVLESPIHRTLVHADEATSRERS